MLHNQIVKMRGHLEDIDYWIELLESTEANPDLVLNMVKTNTSEIRRLMSEYEHEICTNKTEKLW